MHAYDEKTTAKPKPSVSVPSDELRVAITFHRPGGQPGLTKFEAPLSPNSVQQFVPDPVDMDKAIYGLSKLGFVLSRRGRMSVSMRVTRAGYEKACGTKLSVQRVETRNIKIQPILTPDNYQAEVLKLVESAETSFFMQTQYIHPSDKAEDQDFADLISAIVDLQRAGKDVRIILSQFEKEGNWLDLLQATGMDLASVRIQTGVHNKGIVVDSKVVMVGSQNWSGDGVLRNRDASLIVFDEDAARYYEQIFLHDWTNMSKPSQ